MTSQCFATSAYFSICRDDDMISLASNLSVSNLSTIGFLEDDDEGPVQ